LGNLEWALLPGSLREREMKEGCGIGASLWSPVRGLLTGGPEGYVKEGSYTRDFER